LAGRAAGARTCFLLSTYHFSSFSISTISVSCNSEELHFLRVGEHEFLERRWGMLVAGGTTCEMQEVRVHGLLASSALSRSEDGGKSCPVLFSV